MNVRVAANQTTHNLEYVPCALCGKDVPRRIFLARDTYTNVPGTFTVVQCSGCGFVYTNPRPTEKELSKYYPDDAGYFQPTIPKDPKGLKKKMFHALKQLILTNFLGYSHLGNKTGLSTVLSFPGYLLVRRKWLMNGLPRFKKNGKLLDIGCSYGLFLKQMQQLGWNVTGVEPNQKAATFGKNTFNLSIITGDFDHIELNDSFDVITMRMALEHVPSPVNTLKKVYNLLSKGGILIISVPDFSGIEFRLFKAHCYALHAPQHLSHFTPRTITALCKMCGFSITKIIHQDYDRDFVASSVYLKREGQFNYLADTLSNPLFRNTILKAVVKLLSYCGHTSRMTIWAIKN